MKIVKDTKKVKQTEGTYFEFLDYTKKTERSKKSISHGYNSSETQSKDFTGTKNIKQAYDYAFNGWDAGLEQLELTEGLLDGAGTEFNPNVVGSVVNIGAYLKGEPLNMFELKEKREYGLPELTIYTPLMYSAYISEAQAMQFCKSCIRVVNEHQSTHNVKLVGVFDTLLKNFRYTNDILIKDFDKRFVINNIAFSYHPSFFRRIWFKMLETEEFCQAGYGRTQPYDKIKKRIKDEHSDTSKYMILPMLNDTEGGFENNKITKSW